MRQVDWNVRFANAGTGAFRWIPTISSISARIGRLRRVTLASGANRVPQVPRRSVWPRPQSRSFGRLPSRIRARAWLFISAIFTPAGHEVVHQPQPEQ